MKGVTIWILGFAAFFAGANAINALIMWFNLGPLHLFTPFLLGGLGQIPVYVYFLISIILTLVFLAGLSHKLEIDLLNEDKSRVMIESIKRLETEHQSHQKALQDLQEKVFAIDGGLERNLSLSRELSEQGTNMLHSMDNDHQTSQSTMQELQAKISTIEENVARTTELSRGHNEQGESILRSLESSYKAQQTLLETLQKQVLYLDERVAVSGKGGKEPKGEIKVEIPNYEEKIAPQIADVKETVAKKIGDVEKSMAESEQRQKKTASTITKQRTEIVGIQSKLEKLESELTPPKPVLTSRSNVKQIKGIGPIIGQKLKESGITTVGDLVIADTARVAEKSGTSEKNIKKWQQQAQLMMVPGLSEKDMFLLEQVDVVDRQSLADKDPIELTKKLNGIFKANLEKGRVSKEDKPTIEEITSWIKFAKI